MRVCVQVSMSSKVYHLLVYGGISIQVAVLSITSAVPLFTGVSCKTKVSWIWLVFGEGEMLSTQFSFVFAK